MSKCSASDRRAVLRCVSWKPGDCVPAGCQEAGTAPGAGCEAGVGHVGSTEECRALPPREDRGPFTGFKPWIRVIGSDLRV